MQVQKIKKKQKWSQEELQLLQDQYPLYSSKKWKQIAENFKKLGYQRTQIECREKWINFLDPELNNNEWQEQELEKLYEIHDQVGTKWCVIQKYIGRTQNKIKNRFYGTLRNYVRFVVNYLEESDHSYNNEIGKLSPKFLNDMYKAQNQFRFLNDEIRDTIFEMRFKVERGLLAQKIKKKKNLYLRLKGLIFKAFNNGKKGKQGRGGQKMLSRPLEDPIKAEMIEMEAPLQCEVQKSQKNQKADSQAEEIKIQAKQQQIQEEKAMNDYYPFLNYPLLPFHACALPMFPFKSCDCHMAPS